MGDDGFDRLDRRLDQVEVRIFDMSKTLASNVETLRHFQKLEGVVGKVQADLDAAHTIIQANKMVIDMVRWATVLVVPATLSVLVALALEIFA